MLLEFGGKPGSLNGSPACHTKTRPLPEEAEIEPKKLSPVEDREETGPAPSSRARGGFYATGDTGALTARPLPAPTQASGERLAGKPPCANVSFLHPNPVSAYGHHPFLFAILLPRFGLPLSGHSGAAFWINTMLTLSATCRASSTLSG